MHNVVIYLIISLFLQPQTMLLSFDTESVDTLSDVSVILNLLDKYNASSTFFVTGQFAESYPFLVRNISVSNEIACHSYSHPDFTKISYEEKKTELVECKNIIYNITGKYPLGFRAPYTKIDSETFYLLEQQGFLYDASRFDFFPFSPNNITEIPVSTHFFVPLEDVIWLYYFNINNYYFLILKYYYIPTVSYLFHPHHIINSIEQFEDFLLYHTKQNTRFITHEQYLHLK